METSKKIRNEIIDDLEDFLQPLLIQSGEYTKEMNHRLVKIRMGFKEYKRQKLNRDKNTFIRIKR